MKLGKRAVLLAGLAAVFVASFLGAVSISFSTAVAQNPYLVGGELEITAPPAQGGSLLPAVLAVAAIGIGVAVASRLR